jgi:hypothetical protein
VALLLPLLLPLPPLPQQQQQYRLSEQCLLLRPPLLLPPLLLLPLLPYKQCHKPMRTYWAL